MQMHVDRMAPGAPVSMSDVSAVCYDDKAIIDTYFSDTLKLHHLPDNTLFHQPRRATYCCEGTLASNER